MEYTTEMIYLFNMRFIMLVKNLFQNHHSVERKMKIYAREINANDFRIKRLNTKVMKQEDNKHFKDLM